MSLASPVRSRSKRGSVGWRCGGGVRAANQTARAIPGGRRPPSGTTAAADDGSGASHRVTATVLGTPRYVQTACPYSRDRYSTDSAVLGSLSSRHGRMPRGRRQRQPLTAALNRDTMGGRQLLARGTRYGTLVFGAGQPPAARTCLHRRDGGNARRATRHRDAARGRRDHDTADGRPAAGPRRRRLFDAVA